MIAHNRMGATLALGQSRFGLKTKEKCRLRLLYLSTHVCWEMQFILRNFRGAINRNRWLHDMSLIASRTLLWNECLHFASVVLNVIQ